MTASADSIILYKADLHFYYFKFKAILFLFRLIDIKYVDCY